MGEGFQNAGSGSDYWGAAGAAGQISSDLIASIAALIAAGKETQSSKMARGKWERMQKPAAEILSQLYYNPVAENFAAPYTEAAKWKQWENSYRNPRYLRGGESNSMDYDPAAFGDPTRVAWRALEGGGWNLFGGGGSGEKKPVPGPNQKVNPYNQYEGSYKYAPTKAMQSLYSNYLNRQYGLSSDVAGSMVAQSLAPVRIGQLRGTIGSAAASKLTQGDASAIANAGMGVQNPEALRAQNYLQDSTKLAAFNLWRAQQLGSTIG